MHFVNYIPCLAKEATLRSCGSTAVGDLSPDAEFILLPTITTLSYIRKMNIYIHDFKL